MLLDYIAVGKIVEVRKVDTASYVLIATCPSQAQANMLARTLNLYDIERTKEALLNG